MWQRGEAGLDGRSSILYRNSSHVGPSFHVSSTGGIRAGNAKGYLDLPGVSCVGGSWLTPADDVRRGDWAAISERTRRSLAGLSARG